jgi:hypothetical protein
LKTQTSQKILWTPNCEISQFIGLLPGFSSIYTGGGSMLRDWYSINRVFDEVVQLNDIKIDEDALGPSGFPDVDRLDLFVLMDGYRTLGHYLGEPFVVGKDF